ncbi:transcription elongation factor GreB [Fluviispira sanaruensis]|uniref:Transcription elongation factor GreB n=1 Tax=Fluviispira sanaruensis TaxID=2493639 RepID=A0A4P2VHP6_FLUSA|nr:transcription elongation factor GreB [Fluviispira sanaruensis]BBH52261.1 transcription elongation factor GreB [Fluviispira sanaruensis]
MKLKSEESKNPVNLITPEGYKKLIDEFTELSKIERPAVVQEVSAAAKQGDRSENAEYQYGKKRLREIDRRLRFLDKRISLARIVNPQEQVGDKILFGATVTLKNMDGKKVIYQIVGEDEANLSLKKVSWKSPLGNELLNKKVGEIAVVEAPVGLREYEIVDFIFK